MKGFFWAIKHTFLTLIGKRNNLIGGEFGQFPTKKALIKTIWRVKGE